MVSLKDACLKGMGLIFSKGKWGVSEEQGWGDFGSSKLVTTGPGYCNWRQQELTLNPIRHAMRFRFESRINL